MPMVTMSMDDRYIYAKQSPCKTPMKPLVSDYDITGSTLRDSGMTHQTTNEYELYPKDKMFINSSYTRDPLKDPDDARPTSDRDAVMLALRGLQEKIHKLELERSEAEGKLRTLSTETSKYRDVLQQQDFSQSPDMSVEYVAHDTQPEGLRNKLENTENQCELLQKQLDYMRNMVHNAEKDRTEALQRTAFVDKHRGEYEEQDKQTQLHKISQLERDHLRLTATQTLAENKIRELEEKLKEEKHYRKLMQGKAAELETISETNRIMLQMGNKSLVKPRKVKKKKIAAGKKAIASRKKGREPPDCYTFKTDDLPFVAGKATTPTYSLPGKYQEVISMLKIHNRKLCSPRSGHYRHDRAAVQLQQQWSSSSSGISSQGSELDDLMLQLQDEFGTMSRDHQELSNQIQEATDPSLREDLERENERLLTRMELKADQISRLRKHKDMGEAKKPKKKAKAAIVSTSPNSAKATIPSTPYGEVQVTTTVCTKEKGMSGRFHPGSAQASLLLFKDLKQIQSILRRDEVSWD